VFAIVGALLFGASLALFAIRYFWTWAAPVPGGGADPWRAVAVDSALFTVFALHHSLFARLGLRAWLAARVSPALERATYVWIASLLFIVVLVAWQPVPGVLWTTGGWLRAALLATQAAGAIVTTAAAMQVDAFELAGLRQAGVLSPPPPRALAATGWYAFVRHPIYLAWLLLVWPTPTMTGTRLVFAAVSTAYLVIAIPFEERTLVRTIGQPYVDYQRKVKWRIVPGLY
jgi:protein-S-isoprenylcysteine O-methyltransferase Ste14